MFLFKVCERILARLRLLRWRLSGLVLAKQLRIGSGVDIQNAANLKLAAKVTIYKNVSMYIGEYGLLSLGQQSHIAPFAYFLIGNNRLRIGQNVAIGPFCSFFCHSNTHAGNKLFIDSYSDADITIGNNVFIGSHCIILPGSKIGDDVMVAANSVVRGELLSAKLYGGSPAVILKSLGQFNHNEV